MSVDRREFVLALAAVAAGCSDRTPAETTTVQAPETPVYVIAEPCLGVKDTACVDVCPVDCIHPKKDEADYKEAPQLYIHPDECIACGACIPACPVQAVFEPGHLPSKWAQFAARNRDYYRKKAAPAI